MESKFNREKTYEKDFPIHDKFIDAEEPLLVKNGGKESQLQVVEQEKANYCFLHWL